MKSRVAAVIAVACLTVGGAIGGAQARFEAVDQGGVKGVPGLQIITLRDAALKKCYTVFLSDSARAADAAREAPVDLEQARTERDSRLADLVGAFERDRSAIPGTIAPNPFRYEWPAATAQLEYGLLVLDREFARLEQRLDRIGRASRTAIAAIPAPCGPSDVRESP